MRPSQNKMRRLFYLIFILITGIFKILKDLGV
jgi:hypothetical protein